MAVFAVVPVKGLRASKRRLSTVLSPQERRLLTLAMLEDVLKTVKSSVVHEIVVVSNDSNVRQVAHKFGASYLSASRMGLNSTIEEATTWCMRNHSDSVLILPADISLVSPKDIDRIVELGSDGTTLVISPSRNGGTNALFQNPPNLIRSRFGPNSFIKHVRDAHSKGIRVRFYYSVGIATDIDSAEDLKKLLEIENTTMCRHILEQSKLCNQVRNSLPFKAAKNKLWHRKIVNS
jgi:2-phospho-L-lactate guanylyltransferase